MNSISGDTGGEFKAGILFMGVRGWRVCFYVRSYPLAALRCPALAQLVNSPPVSLGLDSIHLGSDGEG